MNASPDAYRRIWAVVAQIPRGRVCTYGQVAALAGFPRGARMAGHALSRTPPNIKLPWHRVVNAQGRISFPSGTAAWREQRLRLRAEGVVFERGRIDLRQWGWRSRLDAPLLD